MKNTKAKEAGRLDIPKGTYARKVMVARLVALSTHMWGCSVSKDNANNALHGMMMAEDIGRALSVAHRQAACPHLWWNNGDGTWECLICELEGVEDGGDGEPLKGANI